MSTLPLVLHRNFILVMVVTAGLLLGCAGEVVDQVSLVAPTSTPPSATSVPTTGPVVFEEKATPTPVMVAELEPTAEPEPEPTAEPEPEPTAEPEPEPTPEPEPEPTAEPEPAATATPVPPAVSSISPVNGAEVYAITCARCHGQDGLGSDLGSSLIGIGRSYGQGSMVNELTNRHPYTFGFKDKLSEQEIADVVAYVLSRF